MVPKMFTTFGSSIIILNGFTLIHVSYSESKLQILTANITNTNIISFISQISILNAMLPNLNTGLTETFQGWE